MDEFELIRRFWQPLGEPAPEGLIRGIGDDCSELAVPSGQHLVQSIDTLVSGVHFPADSPPYDLGWRALAVSASDLAAAGATPWNAFLALTLPRVDEDWLAALARGLKEASRSFGLPLIGGDTTGGPLTLTLQVQGLCPAGEFLSRAGARAGDLICVSGTLGDAGEALRWLDQTPENEDVAAVCKRYWHPMPRLELGQRLRGRASACLDISDGLLADLGHILAASRVGASLDLSAIPLSPALLSLAATKALDLALTAGDDYELCFTWPPAAGDPEALGLPGVGVRVIGEVEPEPGLRLRGQPPGWEVPAVPGYRHFRG